MRFEVEAELENLKLMLKNNEMKTDKANNFIDQTEYEDEYSHNEIDEIQDEFTEEAYKYLNENYKGQYVIFSDWSVHIITKEFYDEKIHPNKPTKRYKL